MAMFWGALVVLTGWLPKLRVVGEKVTATSAPVPLKGMLALELPLTDRVPLSVPRTVGVKVTLMEQLAPAAKEVPQLFVWLKSPVVLKPVIVSGAPPVFDKLTLCAALEVPIGCAE